MNLPIVNTGVLLYISPYFLSQVDEVIANNSDNNTQLVALFLSRLIKGLQNLSNMDTPTDSSWGKHTYTIEDIGIVSFRPVIDREKQQPAIAIEQIEWTFVNSYFFNSFK